MVKSEGRGIVRGGKEGEEDDGVGGWRMGEG